MAIEFDVEAQIADFHKRKEMLPLEDHQNFIFGELVAELKRIRDTMENIATSIDLIENKMT